MGKVREALEAVKNVGVGMGITFKNMVSHPSITEDYPFTKREVPPGYRGIPVLLSDEDGDLKCISCRKCENICPIQCITIEDHRDEETRRKVVDRFDLDASICMFCGLCAEVCPVEGKAIAMSDIYELTMEDPDEFVFDKNKLRQLGLAQKEAAFNNAVRTNWHVPLEMTSGKAKR